MGRVTLLGNESTGKPLAEGLASKLVSFGERSVFKEVSVAKEVLAIVFVAQYLVAMEVVALLEWTKSGL